MVPVAEGVDDGPRGVAHRQGPAGRAQQEDGEIVRPGGMQNYPSLSCSFA